MADSFLCLDDLHNFITTNAADDKIIISSTEPAFPRIIRSHRQADGFSVVVQDPLFKTNRTLFKRISEQVQNYKHEHRAIGGYWSAGWNINDSQDRIEDWIQEGLARHIETHNAAMETVFEGFVNKITAKFGALRFTLGPLMDIGNKVRVVYSSFDNTISPAVKGTRLVTDWAEDAASQARYGVIEKVLSLGGASTENAEQVRDAWIKEHAYPETSLTASLGRNVAPNVAIETLGYWHYLRNYTYTNDVEVTGEHTGANNASVLTDAGADFVNDGVVVGMLVKNLTDDSEATIGAVTATTITGTLAGGTDDDWDTGDDYRVGFTQDLSSKMQAVINADPNSLFSTDFSKITANTLQVDQQEDNNRRAETIFKQLNSYGDASLNRYNVGVYANRQVIYQPAPTTITYQQRVTDKRSQVHTLNGGLVKPWNVKPGNWVFYPDFLAGRLPPVSDNFQSDPRVGYVEGVRFTAPDIITIDGEKLSQMDQVLAKLGLLGVGV